MIPTLGEFPHSGSGQSAPPQAVKTCSRKQIPCPCATRRNQAILLPPARWILPRRRTVQPATGNKTWAVSTPTHTPKKNCVNNNASDGTFTLCSAKWCLRCYHRRHATFAVLCSPQARHPSPHYTTVKRHVLCCCCRRTVLSDAVTFVQCKPTPISSPHGAKRATLCHGDEPRLAACAWGPARATPHKQPEQNNQTIRFWHSGNPCMVASNPTTCWTCCGAQPIVYCLLPPPQAL